MMEDITNRLLTIFGLSFLSVVELLFEIGILFLVILTSCFFSILFSSSWAFLELCICICSIIGGGPGWGGGLKPMPTTDIL